MMAATATKSKAKLVEEDVNEWGDVTEDAFLTPLMKVGTVSAFGLLLIARITSAILFAVMNGKFLGILNEQGAPAWFTGNLTAISIFAIFDVLALLAFVGFLAIPALFNGRMQPWARVTFLSVAMVVLTASNIAGGFFLGQLLGGF